MSERLLPEWKSLPALGEREVQVFALRAGGDGALLARAQGLLSAGERERAARIRVDLPRAEFVVGRAALRVLLGLATGSRPEALPLEVDAFGKPLVPGVYSNVSHSRGLIYLALCRSAPVGIDVEWIDPALEALEIAEANFRPEETAWIVAETDPFARARAFCRVWTKKEAVAKAHGQGLQISLRDIRVPSGYQGLAWIETNGGAHDALADAGSQFHVQELPAPTGFAGALAVRGQGLSTVFLPKTSRTR